MSYNMEAIVAILPKANQGETGGIMPSKPILTSGWTIAEIKKLDDLAKAMGMDRSKLLRMLVRTVDVDTVRGQLPTLTAEKIREAEKNAK